MVRGRRPAEVLPVWPERGAVQLMEDAAIGDLLETLSHAHCTGRRVLTAKGGSSGSHSISLRGTV